MANSLIERQWRSVVIVAARSNGMQHQKLQYMPLA